MNRLKNENSLYLQQHADNPVDWYAWGSPALEKAKQENKPLLISIGYAACHWCHVMAHESFENENVAKIMNEHFVCIKIDREQRPDIDQIYMNAAHLLTGRGGWPLNCLALPDGRPFYAGTYFKPQNWSNLLLQVADLWQNKPDTIFDAAQKIEQGLHSIDLITQKSDDFVFDFDLVNQVVENLKSIFDLENGGFGNAPKFPIPGIYKFLFRAYFLTNDKELAQFIQKSLKKMAFGGIFDQIGGGFARYSVDNEWHIPHFEKMLYDNTQLASIYSQAYQLTNNEWFKIIVDEIFNFLERELKSPENGFYSALDADSEGEEGKFYTWTYNEIKNLIPDSYEYFTDFFNVLPQGNWEGGKNVLRIVQEKEYYFNKFSISENLGFEKIQNAKKILLQYQLNRQKPLLDDKIIASWNAQVIIAYLDAYEAFSYPIYLEKAREVALFLSRNMIEADGKIYRTFKAGKTQIDAFLDDYAFMIQAFIKFYKNSFSVEFLQKALEMTIYTMNHFFDKESGMFFYTSFNNSELFTRKMELNDNVIPSSNAVMAHNLYVLSFLFEKMEWQDLSFQMVANMKTELANNAYFRYEWNFLYSIFTKQQIEIVIVGENAKTVLFEINKKFLPGIIVFATDVQVEIPIFKERFMNDKTLIYVCKNKSCHLPVTSIDDALELI